MENGFKLIQGAGGQKTNSIRKLKEAIKRHKYDKRTKSCEQPYSSELKLGETFKK